MGLKDYGQVYQCLAPEKGRYGWKSWRGVLWAYDDDGNGRMAWSGAALDDPDDAYVNMVKNASEHGITDLRKWNGKTPELSTDV